jgi:hypothetical protein
MCTGARGAVGRQRHPSRYTLHSAAACPPASLGTMSSLLAGQPVGPPTFGASGIKADQQMMENIQRTLVRIVVCVAFALLPAGCQRDGTAREASDALRRRIAHFGTPDLIEETSGDLSRRFRPRAVPEHHWPDAEQVLYYVEARRQLVFSPGRRMKTLRMTEETARSVEETLRQLPP